MELREGQDVPPETSSCARCESQAGRGFRLPPHAGLGCVKCVNSPPFLSSLQQMERILKKASKTHKQRVEVSYMSSGEDQAM